MAELELEQRLSIVKQALGRLVTENAHGEASLITEGNGVFRIGNREGRGLLGLGCDTQSGDVWICPTQNFEAFQRKGGWDANDLMPLASDTLDPRIKRDTQMEIVQTSDGTTEYRFLKNHWLTKLNRSMQEAGVKLDGSSLHVAQKSDWSDHVAAELRPDGDALIAGPFPGKGYVEMKLAIKGLGGTSWSDGKWAAGANQELRIKPLIK